MTKDVIQEAILGILSASNRVMIEEDKHSTCRFLDYFVESLTKLHETHGKAINALVSGEGVVVPVEPTEEMLDATKCGWHYNDVYKAMTQAGKIEG